MKFGKKTRILMRPQRRCKKPVRTQYYVCLNRNLGVRTGWHCQASFQKFLQNYQNWRATLVHPRNPGVILRCGDTLFSFGRSVSLGVGVMPGPIGRSVGTGPTYMHIYCVTLRSPGLPYSYVVLVTIYVYYYVNTTFGRT